MHMDNSVIQYHEEFGLSVLDFSLRLVYTGTMLPRENVLDRRLSESEECKMLYLPDMWSRKKEERKKEN